MCTLAICAHHALFSIQREKRQYHFFACMAPRGRRSSNTAAAKAAMTTSLEPEDLASETDVPEGPPAPAGPELPTAPELSQVVGNLSIGSVKHPLHFMVEAYDTSGQRKHIGGDAFFIAIRGASRVRAKVTDMRDGRYACEWTPTTSGTYQIAVSLFGVSLPGSPFSLNVHMPYPHAPNCIARGGALSHVTARAPQVFEVLFRDRMGNIAPAVDLDVFVQPVLGHAGANPRQQDMRMPPIDESVAIQQPSSSRNTCSEGKKPTGEQEALPTDASYDHEEVQLTSAGGLASTRRRTINIQVGKKPLVVRESCEIDSPTIGQLLPGQLATVVEERCDIPGTIRACITIDEDLTLHALQSTRGEGQASRRERSLEAEIAKATAAVEQLHWTKEQQQQAEMEKVDYGLRSGRGWVTLVKDGRKLVSSRVRLHAGSRQAHMHQWTRRLHNDRFQHDVSAEVASDPTGVGFAFGGVEPGVLHSRGVLHEAHKVHFSIGIVGHYLLHVRLRQAALPFPGSPFSLHVSPDKPSAERTSLPKQPDGMLLTGKVGTSADAGCRLVLSTTDKMGNVCVEGGADVKLLCETEGVEANVLDQGDGTYVLEWKSNKSGEVCPYLYA
jgi:hypothetical protein